MRCSRAWQPVPSSTKYRFSRAGFGSKGWHIQGHRSPVQLFHRRHFGLESVPAVLLPPVVFGGLLISLWAYKCLMMVVFQNKIIYMPSVPPFSRSEKVSDYAARCRPVEWIERDLKAVDGTALKLLEGSIVAAETSDRPEHVVVVYFQG